VLLRSSDAAVQAMAAPGHAAAAANVVHGWMLPDGGRFSGLHGAAKVADGGDVRFFLSVDRHRDAALLSGFLKTTMLATPLLLFMVAMGAGLIASTGLEPLRNFNRLAASIGAKSLNQRIALAGLPRELADTAKEVNGMLERIDASYRQLEDFSGDLAHEMRTPVATLLGRTQVALSQPRTAGEMREVLEGNAEELNRLSTIISDMLFIAQAEHYAVPIEAGLVDLAREARTVADYLSLIAEEKNVRIEVSGRADALSADRLLIQRAITNLVSNAIRHASPHSVVGIEVASARTETTLAVTNSGEPIAPANLQRIFDRFYRVDPARARVEGGSGLGLAIVRSIATAHGGSVAVRSDAGRTTFTLLFPKSRAG
jgi:two-component system, OmpR family, heavy metal sensor histidine kinase CusS